MKPRLFPVHGLPIANRDAVDAQKTSGRGPSPGVGRPMGGGGGLVPDEVVVKFSNSVNTLQVEALQRRFGLARLESQTFQLSNSTLYRWRTLYRCSVASVVLAHSKATGS